MKDAFIKWLIPFFCGSIASFFGTALSLWKINLKKSKAIETGLQCLLRAEIIRMYEKSMERGYCPLYLKDSLKRAYDSYHILGGNDVATDLFRQIMALPTEPKNTQEGKKDENRLEKKADK